MRDRRSKLPTLAFSVTRQDAIELTVGTAHVRTGSVFRKRSRRRLCSSLPVSCRSFRLLADSRPASESHGRKLTHTLFCDPRRRCFLRELSFVLKLSFSLSTDFTSSLSLVTRRGHDRATPLTGCGLPIPTMTPAGQRDCAPGRRRSLVVVADCARSVHVMPRPIGAARCCSKSENATICAPIARARDVRTCRCALRN